MRFNDEFQITEKYNYFDPILIADTELFVDPFAIFTETDGVFADSYDKILRFFNEAFKLAAKSDRNTTSISYKKLQDMLVFPEINEIGLGYSGSNSGAGASKHFRDQIIDAIYYSIERGLKEYRHFEEIGIFEEGIGCDRISDITCNILKSNIIRYTQNICQQSKISMVPVRMRHIDFDFNQLRWIDGTVNLPYNKYKNRGILLVPEKFVNDLPTINADDFKDYIWVNKNEALRNDFNYAIKKDIDKQGIIRIARNNPDWVLAYEEFKERKGFKPYNLELDPKGKYLWSSNEVQKFISQNPIKCNGKDDLAQCITDMCYSFKSFIENEGGYKLLWNGDRPKPESAAQLLLYGITKAHCMHLDIDISKECNAGSGPVDFKYSQGYKKRVLLETKLVSNSKYWNGLTKQLPKYMDAEGIQNGIYMIIAFNSNEFNKCNELKQKIKGLEFNYSIEIIVIDASNDKISASKL